MIGSFSLFGKRYSTWWILVIIAAFMVLMASFREIPKPDPIHCCKCCVALEYLCCTKVQADAGSACLGR